MFDEYKASVLHAYTDWRAANALSPNLMRPTPKKLRDECLVVFNSRYSKKDEGTVKSFFGSKNDTTEYIQAIRKCDVDKFRPLDNFLKGNTADTEDKNVELLAWLINFQPRPYAYGQTYPADNSGETRALIKTEIEERIIEEPAVSGSWKKYIVFGIVLAIVGAGTYLLFSLIDRPKDQTSVHLKANGKCMYWAGNHYVPGRCDQKHGDTPVVELDSVKLVHFKKITDTNSITENSVRKVWYAKINKKLELFTDSGFHPVDTGTRLKPLTKYMVEKYVLHQ